MWVVVDRWAEVYGRRAERVEEERQAVQNLWAEVESASLMSRVAPQKRPQLDPDHQKTLTTLATRRLMVRRIEFHNVWLFLRCFAELQQEKSILSDVT
jgi:hypothetical protein